MEDKTESTVVDNSEVVKESIVAEKATVTLKDMLSEEFKENKSLANFESLDDLAKSYVNAQSMIGKKVTDMSAEDLVAINEGFGKPLSAEAYNFEADETFKNRAFDAGLNHIQAKALYDFDSKARAEASTLRDIADEEAVVSLEEVFGPKLEQSVELAKKAALDLGGDDLYKAVFADDVTKDVNLIKALSEAGKRLYDHVSVDKADLTSAANSLDEVQQVIDNNLGDPAFMKKLGNPSIPGHKEATAMLTKAYKDKALLVKASRG